MATIYNYTIDRMDVVDTTQYPNYVLRVYYSYTGTDGDYTASVSGNINYEVTEGTLTPYEELTETQVITWVESALTEEGVALNKKYVDNAIEEEKNPQPVPHKEELPWN